MLRAGDGLAMRWPEVISGGQPPPGLLGVGIPIGVWVSLWLHFLLLNAGFVGGRAPPPRLELPGGPPLRRRPRLRPGPVGPRRVPAPPPRRLVGVPFPDPLPNRNGANLG